MQLLKSWGAFRVVTCSPYRAVRLARLLCGSGGDIVIPAMPDHCDTEDTCRQAALAWLISLTFSDMERIVPLSAPNFRN